MSFISSITEDAGDAGMPYLGRGSRSATSDKGITDPPEVIRGKTFRLSGIAQAHPVAFLLAKVLVVGTIFLALYVKGAFDGIPALFFSADHTLLIVGGAATVVQTAISAWKWLILIGRRNSSIRFWELMRIYLAANFVNLFTPSFIGGDAYRTAKLRNISGGVGRAFSTVIVDRITGLIALIFLAGIGAISLFIQHDRFVFDGAFLVLLTLSGVAGLMFLKATLARWPVTSAPAVRAVAEEILQAIQPGRTLVMCLALSLLFQANVIVINWIYGSALGLSATFQQLVLIVPLVYLLEMVPLSINGIGLREGGFALLFAVAGLPSEQGLALGLAISLMRYVVATCCGLPCLMWMQGRLHKADEPHWPQTRPI
jgi:uncharacterized membrane protein YbhN (UPF0104 family)